MKYICLEKQIFQQNNYSFLPLRFEDRFQIMKWRNEQMYHLRQSELLTIESQDEYFRNTILKLFDQKNPTQLLFSICKGNELIAYGGLVHINWVDKNAEISLVIDTTVDPDLFSEIWNVSLSIFKQIAFKQLRFKKIYTYAFDIRPFLYPILENNGFKLEARLKNHCCIDDKYYDVLIHTFYNPNQLICREVLQDDIHKLYKWVNDSKVRLNSLDSKTIPWETHVEWFNRAINNINSKIYIFESDGHPVGQVRIDFKSNCWEFDYSVDKNYRGLGLGRSMIESVLKSNPGKKFKAVVKKRNLASQNIFRSLGFVQTGITISNNPSDNQNYIFLYG